MTFSLGSTPRSLVKYNDQSISAITDIATSAKDDMVLIKTLTASSDNTLEFDSDIDSTYPIYLIKWINIHPGTDDQDFGVNFRDGGSAYDAPKTTAPFGADHKEDDTVASMEFKAGNDLAQSTAVQDLGASTGADNDQSTSGELWLFNPSSTTFVKHWISRSSQARHSDAAQDFYTAGYCNTTSAIDGVQFTFQSGNIDSGTFKMYGVS